MNGGTRVGERDRGEQERGCSLGTFVPTAGRSAISLSEFADRDIELTSYLSENNLRIILPHWAVRVTKPTTVPETAQQTILVPGIAFVFSPPVWSTSLEFADPE